MGAKQSLLEDARHDLAKYGRAIDLSKAHLVALAEAGELRSVASLALTNYSAVELVVICPRGESVFGYFLCSGYYEGGKDKRIYFKSKLYVMVDGVAYFIWGNSRFRLDRFIKHW